MKKSKKVLVVIIALFGLLLTPLAMTGTVLAQASDRAACEGLGGSWRENKCSVGNEPDIESVLSNFIQVLSVIAGIASVIMIIISGFRFITANGDSNTVAAARRTLMYALVGVVIVAISQFIVQFVLTRTVG